MTPRWKSDGPRYGLDWGGRSWCLDVEAATPGLTSLDGSVGPLLAVEGIDALARSERGVFGRACLVSHEIRSGRVEAVYVPVGWKTLRVRAAWWPRDPATVDLEVQIQAFTVDELQRVMIVVAGATGLSTYRQIAHPHDVASGEDSDEVRRSWLFGHDLEKGVVLRGRVRGIWFEAEPGPDDLDRVLAAFLTEPLPLGT